MKKFLIIDGTALVFRGFYAIPHLASSEKKATNAIFGFYTILFNLLLEEVPDYLAICFDRPEETHRKKDFADYKAQRTKAPDALYEQIGPIKDILEEGQLNLIEKAGFEADDIIATLAVKNQSPDLNTLIYSSDLDLIQLINDHIFVLKPGNSKTGNTIVKAQDIINKYGFSPVQVQDYKGLRGDTSDNIPGVKGIGEKTATELIKNFQNLENIYQNLDSISPSIRAKLEADKDNAFFCKKLATLHDDIEVDHNLASYQIHNLDFDVIQKKLEQLEMRKLVEKLIKLKNKISQVKPPEAQQSLF
jgi:DNA polymerase-1